MIPCRRPGENHYNIVRPSYQPELHRQIWPSIRSAQAHKCHCYHSSSNETINKAATEKLNTSVQDIHSSQILWRAMKRKWARLVPNNTFPTGLPNTGHNCRMATSSTSQWQRQSNVKTRQTRRQKLTTKGPLHQYLVPQCYHCHTNHHTDLAHGTQPPAHRDVVHVQH